MNCVAVDASGNLYIGDSGNNRIRKVTISTGLISTVAGGGTPCAQATDSYGDGCPATSATLPYLASVFIDTATNLFIADAGTGTIREVTASTGYISAVAGGNPACPQAIDIYGDGCPATLAALSNPTGVAVDATGRIYIADNSDDRIRSVGPTSGIVKITPSITWPTPTAIPFGTALKATQLDASSNQPGSFIYTPALGTVLPPGPNSLSVIFAPSNSTFYNTTSASITLTVVQAAPAITWTTPTPITYGTALSSAQLNASSVIACSTLTYSPAAGTVLTGGAHTLSVTCAPTDTTDYTTSTATVTLMVNQGTPVITWAPPSDIVTGTALSATQLNASSTIPGTLTYSPPPGTVLAGGPHTLSVTLTPIDTTNYTTATANAYLTVTQGMSKWDSGTVSLTVNGATVASTNYGKGATPSSIAEGLAAALAGGSPIKLTGVDDALYIQATTAGAASDISYSIQNVTYDSKDFTQPSFPVAPISGILEGGANKAANAATVYSYTVPSGGYDGVGNLTQSVDSVMGTWGFSYDTLNRLAGATDNQPGFPYTNGCWSYDPFGNRTIQAGSSMVFQTGSSSPTPCTPASGALYTSTWAHFNTNNQVTSSTQAPSGLAYDAAGNVLNDGLNQYLYDGDGRICAVANNAIPGLTVMTGYIYDADGQRVAKGRITQWSCDPTLSGFKTLNEYVLGLSGEQVTEMGMDANTNMVWQHSNVYAAGKLLATYDNDGLHFYLNDPLGTRRAQTDYAGVLEQTCSSLPYGDNLNCTGSNQYPTEHHFTGKERDAESGNDYFGARYYASSMGRFMSPDPRLASGHLSNPQSMNRYSYVDDNPLKYFDPDGLEKQLTIYVSQPVFGTRTMNVGPDFGHAFLGLRDTNTRAEHKYGFWPTGKGALLGGGGHADGLVKDESKSPWMVKKTYTISDDDARKLADSINAQLKPGKAPDYDMQAFNCATWVVKESEIAGVTIETKQGCNFAGKCGIDPGDLGQDLRDQGGEVNPSPEKSGGSIDSSRESTNRMFNDMADKSEARRRSQQNQSQQQH